MRSWHSFAKRREHALSKLQCQYVLFVKSERLPIVSSKLLLGNAERQRHRLSVQQRVLWAQWQGMCGMHERHVQKRGWPLALPAVRKGYVFE